MSRAPADPPGLTQPRAVVVDVEESASVRDRTRLLRWAARDAARRKLVLHLVHVWCPWQLRLAETLAAAHGMNWTPGQESTDLTAAELLLASAQRVRAEFPELSIRATVLDAGPRTALPTLAAGADSVVIGASADSRRSRARISPLCSAVAEASGVPVVQHRATRRTRDPVLAVADRLSQADPLIQRALIRAGANRSSARVMLLTPARTDVDQGPRIAELEAELYRPAGNSTIRQLRRTVERCGRHRRLRTCARRIGRAHITADAGLAARTRHPQSGATHAARPAGHANPRANRARAGPSLTPPGIVRRTNSDPSARLPYLGWMGLVRAGRWWESH